MTVIIGKAFEVIEVAEARENISLIEKHVVSYIGGFVIKKIKMIDRLQKHGKFPEMSCV
ncbi:MAG: hypothetical protein ACKE51_00005 [Methylococcaceae bacterium]